MQDFFQVKDSIVYSQLQPKLVHGQLLSAVCNKMCSNSVGIASQESITVHIWLAVNGFLSMFNCPLPFLAQKVRGQIGPVILVLYFVLNNRNSPSKCDMYTCRVF